MRDDEDDDGGDGKDDSKHDGGDNGNEEDTTRRTRRTRRRMVGMGKGRMTTSSLLRNKNNGVMMGTMTKMRRTRMIETEKMTMPEWESFTWPCSPSTSKLTPGAMALLPNIHASALLLLLLLLLLSVTMCYTYVTVGL